jgi:hypothetical protein
MNRARHLGWLLAVPAAAEATSMRAHVTSAMHGTRESVPAILESLVSDFGTLGGLTQFAVFALESTP